MWLLASELMGKSLTCSVYRQVSDKNVRILLLTVFNVTLDYILIQLKRTINDECRKIPDQLFDLEYADDTTLMAKCMDRILELTGLLAEESQKWGLKINTKKTKITPVTKKNGPYQQVFCRGNEREIVYNFVYLGSGINANGSCVSEIRRRMALAGAVMNKL